MWFEKPTIAMVNGWCFGGAFTPLVSCDLAIAAEEATFGLSEINWGILPGGNVTRAVAEVMSHRDALYYIMTGLPFDGAEGGRDAGWSTRPCRWPSCASAPAPGRRAAGEEPHGAEGGQGHLQARARPCRGTCPTTTSTPSWSRCC